jgi:hypothetical protein
MEPTKAAFVISVWSSNSTGMVSNEVVDDEDSTEDASNERPATPDSSRRAMDKKSRKYNKHKKNKDSGKKLEN